MNFGDEVKSAIEAEDSITIPPSLFDEDKHFTLIDTPFCETNGDKPKNFMKKFYPLTNGKYQFSKN